MRSTRKTDEGSTHVLEAVIIASIMVSAVAFVATFETPPSATTAAREPLGQKAQDALAILYDTPATGGMFGDNMLSVLLAQCMNGDCGELETRLQRLLPAGASYSLYVSNGYDTFPVLEKRLPSGEAVTATHLIEPKWSHTFVTTATDSVSPSSDPLLVYSLPIFNSNPTAAGGSTLLVRVHGTRASDGSDYILTTAYGTYAPPQAAADLWPAASLYFVDGSGNPLATHDVRAGSLNGMKEPTRTNVSFRLRLEESAGVPIPAGAEVRVLMPRGWTASADPVLNAADWTILAEATDRNSSYNGSTLRARTLAPVAEGHVDLQFNAIYHGDVLDFYTFHATLSRGALSTADLIVRADEHPTVPSFASPVVAMSVPRPMGATATSQWTLGVYSPHNDSDLAGSFADSIYVHTVEILEGNGDNIFAAVSETIDGPGTWTNGNNQLVWSGAYRLRHNSPLNLTFDVTASGLGGAPLQQSPFEPPVDFDGWNGTLPMQTAPGLHRSPVLPATASYRGYNTDDGDLSLEHTLRSDSIYRAALLRGSTKYVVGMPDTVEDSLYGSFVEVEERVVPIGEDVVINSNVQSVLFALAEAGQRAGVTLRFYPPWSGDDRVPIHEQRNLDGGILQGDITQMVLLDLNDDGHPDPVVATSNGRLLAFNALTGQRLPGGSFTVPLAGNTGVASASISALELINLGGETYFVVGTDSADKRVFVVDQNFELVAGKLLAGGVQAIETTIDFTGDGRNDIIVGTAYLGDSLIYVLSLLEDETEFRAFTSSSVSITDAFYLAPGDAGGLTGLPKVGPFGASPGFVTGIQTTVNPAVTLYFNPTAPAETSFEQSATSMPRAGLRAINQQGAETSTLFGTPVNLARRYNYDGDAVTDLVAAGPAGYVYMLNGRALTQPLYSYVVSGAQSIIDADVEDSVRAYALTDDGQILYTDDGWLTMYCTACEVYIPTANAISSNRTASIWAVGDAGAMWRSTLYPWHDNEAPSNWMPSLHMESVVPLAWEDGIPVLSLSAYNFADVHFGPDPDVGWILGNQPCLLPILDCPPPILLTTVDGGATWEATTDLPGWGTDPLRAQLNRLYFEESGRAWIVGDGGTILRSNDGTTWTALPPRGTAALNDISCARDDPQWCIIVADDGLAWQTRDASAAEPQWTPIVFETGLLGRDLYSVGILGGDEAIIGTRNQVLKTFDGGLSWSAMPMNYIENDGRVVSVAPDGSGYVMGGGPGNGRIWFLHDYATQSMVQTHNLSAAAGIPAEAKITRVSLVASNATVGAGRVEVLASTDATTWKSMGDLTPPAKLDILADSRDYRLQPVTFAAATSSSDLRFQLRLNTSGDTTITTPHVRGMRFLVEYTLSGTPDSAEVDIDFTTATQKHTGEAIWDTAAGVLHQPYIDEYWTRNVSGAVFDLRTGYDINDDGWNEVWVATGSILATNSPDHIPYAGVDEEAPVAADNRVYLLDGRTGRILKQSALQAGNVTQIRLMDADGNGWPEKIYATVWSGDDSTGALAVFNASELGAAEWTVSIGLDRPTDLEAAAAGPAHSTAFVGTAATTESGSGRHIWNINGTTGGLEWRSLPSEMGEYVISKTIPRHWLFGTYVVEVEVEWEDSITKTNGVSSTVLRSARFYDYFMVTPPDSLRPPSPVYNVHLVTWFDDWR